jgi:hypothetical protein
VAPFGDLARRMNRQPSYQPKIFRSRTDEHGSPRRHVARKEAARVKKREQTKVAVWLIRSIHIRMSWVRNRGAVGHHDRFAPLHMLIRMSMQERKGLA